LPLCDNRASRSLPRFKEHAMSQKAICPRGHIWDPSTLAGLPPTETPRCPICGEEEPLRTSNALARLKHWWRRNPLLASLSGLCLLLAVALVVTVLLARSAVQTARSEAENAKIEKQQIEARLGSRLRTTNAEDKEQQSKLQAKVEAERRNTRWENREKEFKAELRAAEKAASDARRQRDEQYQQRKLAEELAQTADQVRQDALARRAEAARQLVKMHVAEGTRLMESGDLSASLLWFVEALRLAEKEKLPAQTHRLRLAAVLAQCPRSMQVWLHDKTLNAVQLSSDGKRVLTAGANGAVEVWDAATGQRVGDVLAHEEPVTHAALSPDGKRVLTAAKDMTLHLWDVEMSKKLISPLQLTGPVAGLAFSADGKRFLTVTDKAPMGATEVELHVRDAETGETVREGALGSEVSPHPATFSPDGKRVLAVCRDRCARIWDIATGKQVGSSFPHAAALVHASFSLDGERVLTASEDGTARVWKVKTGEPMTPLLKHGSAVRGAALSPEGAYVLTFGTDRGVRVWDVNTGEMMGPALRHNEVVSNAVFSPDGRYVLTTCGDGTARLWDYRKSEEILPVLRHGESIRHVVFTPAGDGLWTLAGRVVRLWDLTSGETSTSRSAGVPPAKPQGVPPSLEVFSPDGKLVLRATDTAVRVYDTQTNQPVGGTLPHKNKVTDAAFSSDGKRVLTVIHQLNGDEMEGHVRVWETATGELLGQPLAHPRSVLEAGFSRDGRRVLTACQDGKARLWDVEKNALVGEPMEHKQDLSRALFLPDGKRLLTVDVEGGLRLWDANTAEAVGDTWGHRKPIHHLEFSTDGQQLVTASEVGTASVWEASTGHEIATTPLQGAPVVRAAFSPDGKRIVTVSGDQRARAWDASNGKPVGPPLRHHSAITLAVFSEDGKRIVTVAGDGLRIWEAASGESISPLVRIRPEPTGIHGVSLGRDGRLVLAGVSTAYNLRPEERPAEELLRMAEVLSAERMTDAGETTSLDRAELGKAWQDLQKKYGKDFAQTSQRLAAWHRRGAAECEDQHLWVGALRHLDYLVSTGGSADLYGRRGRANLELRRWEAAKTDYTRAIADNSERWDLWAGRAEAEAALGHWDAAAADYSKAIERKDDRAELWSARGHVEAERGQWRKAAADLGKAIHLGEQDATVWRQHILALLASGDEGNYRRWCGRLMQRYGGSKDEAIFRNVVWTVALAEGAMRDWKPLIQRAEREAATHPQSADHRRQLALLLYRAGQFDASLKQLEGVMEASPSEPMARDGLLMALAAQRLGREEAKKWLDKAEQIHRDQSKNDKRSWEDRLIDEILHREAKTLVQGGKS
jgi:WD40 repeat protein/tetratricopeptide (TPR) repeat protein